MTNHIIPLTGGREVLAQSSNVGIAVPIGEEHWAPDIELEFSCWGSKCLAVPGRGHGEVSSGRNLRCKGYSKNGIIMGWSVDRMFL